MRVLIDTYLAQMERWAYRTKVFLEDACAAEGVERSTLWRWRNGLASPREETYIRVMKRIERMSHVKPH